MNNLHSPGCFCPRHPSNLPQAPASKSIAKHHPARRRRKLALHQHQPLQNTPYRGVTFTSAASIKHSTLLFLLLLILAVNTCHATVLLPSLTSLPPSEQTLFDFPPLPSASTIAAEAPCRGVYNSCMDTQRQCLQFAGDLQNQTAHETTREACEDWRQSVCEDGIRMHCDLLQKKEADKGDDGDSNDDDDSGKDNNNQDNNDGGDSKNGDDNGNNKDNGDDNGDNNGDDGNGDDGGGNNDDGGDNNSDNPVPTITGSPSPSGPAANLAPTTPTAPTAPEDTGFPQPMSQQSTRTITYYSNQPRPTRPPDGGSSGPPGDGNRGPGGPGVSRPPGAQGSPITIVTTYTFSSGGMPSESAVGLKLGPADAAVMGRGQVGPGIFAGVFLMVVLGRLVGFRIF